MVTMGVKVNYLPKPDSLILLINTSSVKGRLVLPNKASGIEKSLCGKQRVTKSALKDFSLKLLKGYY